MSKAGDEDILRLIENGRGAMLEWFSEQTPIDMLAACMSAMANRLGGTILLGVAGPTGSVLGVRNAEATVDQVLQAALRVEPALIIPMPRALTVRGQTVIRIHIPQGMPHIYAVDGRYLQRHDDSNRPLKPHELRRLMFERGEASFETEIANGASLDDIVWEKAQAYAASLGGGADVRQTLIKRGCLTTRDGDLRPTHAGVLLFGRDPQRFVRGAEITAARFAGAQMGDNFTRQDITGTLPDQIRRAETFLIDHLRKNQQLGSSMARAERFEYPLEAVRELVVNAVAHRDYSISGDGIRLYIFADRLEITSAGGLPGPVTIRNIRDERFSRNPAIVQVLADMGFIERLGYGVDRVMELMRSQQLDAPEFEETGGGFRVMLRNKPAEPEPAPEKVIEFKGEYKGTEINPRQEAALVYLHSGESRITNSDLQGLCPDVHPETIRRDLVDLVTKNILQKMGQKRGSYYVLR